MIIRSSRVVMPDGERPASIHIHDGIITDVTRPSSPESAPSGGGADEAIDVGDLVVSPGIVDTHVHVNEPGRTEWEGFDTATRAAAAGGVTTIVDMPLNSIPATTTVAALEAKRAAARGQCQVDVAFWGGVMPGNEMHLDPLIDAGVRGFKCFLVPSGVDEFPAVAEDDLRRALPVLARRDVPLLVHAESARVIADRGLRIAEAANPQTNPQSNLQSTPHSALRIPQYAVYLATRPPEAEVEAIELMARLAKEFGVRIHIVHVAAAEAVDAIGRAKADGVKITAETCPHYLTFSAEDVPDGATEFKCAPPIRESRHRAALWNGMRRGVLDLIATDHSPAPPALKCGGDFMNAWGGIASLQLSLPAVWSGVARCIPRDEKSPEAFAARRVALSRWMSERPAALAGLGHRKGRIAPGFDADLIAWDPDSELVVDASVLQHRHKLTPYDRLRLQGRVIATWLRGGRVEDHSRCAGQLL